MHSSLFRRVLVAASLAAALTVTELSPVAFAAPAAPGNLSPSSIDVSGSPVLSWSRVATAAKYEVVVSTNDSFSNALYQVKTENRRATPTVTLPLGVEVFWRVRGLTSSSVPGPWSIASFTTSTKAGPQLQAPPDGESLQQPDQPPLLSWGIVPGASGYSVEVDNDDQFIGPTVTTVKSTSFLVANPGPEQTYYWRVRANFSGGYSSDYSDTRSFKVLSLPAPELTSPDDSSTTQVQDAVLDWAPVPGAVRYEVRVSTDDQFSSVVDSVTVKSTRYARPETLNNDQYWWQVRAVDVNSNKSPWSTSVNQFQRNWPDQPELIYPANGSTVNDESLYYEWSPVRLASDYRLEVAPDPSFSPGTIESCLTTGTTFAVHRITQACSARVEGTYYWRVRPLDGPNKPAINGIYSDIHSFYYDPDNVIQLPIEEDVNGDISVPTLRWLAYAGAEQYKVTVKKANNSVAATATTFSLAWTPTGGDQLDPDDGPFHWSVQALGADGTKSTVLLDYAQPTFSLAPVPAPEGAPLTLTSPDDVHGLRFPALSWEPDPAATYYKVNVANKGSNAYFQLGDKFPYPAATDDTEKFLVAGDYQWFVESYAQNGALLAISSLGYFTIDPLAAVPHPTVSLTGAGLQDADTRCAKALAPPPELTPICNNLQQTPVFSWDRIDGAAYYMIYLSQDRELTNLIAAPYVTANHMLTLTTQLPDSQAGTAYFWAIRPCKTASVCGPEPTKATNAFDKRSNPVTGLVEYQHDSATPLPADGPGGAPSEFADEVVFAWDDYLATNQQGNDLDITGLPSTVEAKSYTVQISDNPGFTSLLMSKSGIDQTSFTAYTATLPEGPLYWRVLAVDGTGNTLALSLGTNVANTSRAIQKRSPVPQLVSPIGNAKVSGTPAFVWMAQAYAATYDIQVAKNGDESFSSTNRVINEDDLEQATYVATESLDPAGSPYVWRVRRQDVDGNPGPWSTTLGRFSVKGAAPTLIAPAEGTRLSATDALFTWSAVEDAQQYKFEMRFDGSTSVRELVRTVGLNWAPTARIADAKYEWRVSALDVGGKTLGSTSWRNAFVDNSGPEVITRAPSNPNRRSNFVITFDEPVKGLTSATMSIYEEGKARKLSAKVTMNAAHTKAKLNPKRLLKLKGNTIKLKPRITDTYGNKLAAYSWRISIRK